MHAPPFGQHIAGLLPSADAIRPALERVELEAAMLRRMLRLALVREKQLAADASQGESREVVYAS